MPAETTQRRRGLRFRCRPSRTSPRGANFALLPAEPLSSSLSLLLVVRAAPSRPPVEGQEGSFKHDEVPRRNVFRHSVYAFGDGHAIQAPPRSMQVVMLQGREGWRGSGASCRHRRHLRATTGKPGDERLSRRRGCLGGAALSRPKLLRRAASRPMKGTRGAISGAARTAPLPRTYLMICQAWLVTGAIA